MDNCTRTVRTLIEINTVLRLQTFYCIVILIPCELGEFFLENLHLPSPIMAENVMVKEWFLGDYS